MLADIGARECSVCGCEFDGISRARYCSRARASRADHQRHADARREKRRRRHRFSLATPWSSFVGGEINMP
jgi:hypothetical protein